ncbi:MAG: MMPL family transporter [Verrucomicrobiales bacterium]|nr:MMPL family transporter [Verrucomicrobiales bacterium]
MMQQRFRSLAGWVCRHRWQVLGAWGVLLAFGVFGTSRLPGLLLGGSGSIAGSDSHRMEQVLQTEFAYPFSRALASAVHSPRFQVEDDAFQAWLRELEKLLRAAPEVKAVTTWTKQSNAQLRSPDGHGTLVLIGLNAASREEEERLVPVIRKLVEPIGQSIRKADADASLLVLGAAAITYDLNQASQRDARHTEIVTLPITAIILLIAFGTPLAAGLPLLSGVTSTVVSWGLAYLLTFVMPLSNLVENIGTMIGLAVGIDYALLTVSRYREEQQGGGTREEIIARTVGHTGPAILYSGLAVMIGLAGLLLSPLMETRSIGLGGAAVVMVSVLAASTLQPALLAAFGKWLDVPRCLARPLAQSPRALQRWQRLAMAVMRRPWPILAVTLLVLSFMARPALRLHLGFPTSDWLPRSTQSGQGVTLIRDMGMTSTVFPVQMVVRTDDGTPILPGRIPALLELTKKLQSDPKVGTVVSPVMMLAGGGGSLLRALQSNQGSLDWLLSRDRTAALLQIFPAPGVHPLEVLPLANRIKSLRVATLTPPEIGGQAVYYNDIDRSVLGTYPLILSLVVGATLVVLFLAYRSFLLPVKAVLMNLISVAAGYGVVVAVFQEGWCGGFFSLAGPLGAIPVYVPLVIFCIMFGLSMDYEVFLISRIKEAFDRCGDNTRATAEGLAATGSIITQAALVMVAVFGASAWAEVVIVQMIGLGLAVTVFVDATLVRVLLVPAFMRLAGNWNWYPGVRKATATTSPRTLPP